MGFKKGELIQAAKVLIIRGLFGVGSLMKPYKTSIRYRKLCSHVHCRCLSYAEIGMQNVPHRANTQTLA